MKLQPSYILAVFGGAILYFGLAWFIDRTLKDRAQTYFRYVAIIGAAVGFFLVVSNLVDDHARAVDISKALIALVAAGCVFYEAHREGMARPVSERWKKYIGVALGVAAIACYFNGFRFGYPKYYHRWDQYHYYMGAKYFHEAGYDGLYKCSLIAQDELGEVSFENDAGRTVRLDMRKEVRHADKKIRNLGGDNLLKPAADFLEHPEECKAHFSPERWEAYKEDVKFFRTSSDKGYWEDMQKDHGFNPPPVWTILGWFFASMFPAGKAFVLPLFGKVIWLQLLAMLDIVYLAGVFVALWWGFGWRTFAVGAIFWGCQSSAPFYWTGGAFLRQDWLFWLVLAAALARRRWFSLSGASLVYAGLLRIFPGLAVIGWLTVAGWTLVTKRRMPKHHMQLLAGGVIAAAVLIPASMRVCGTSWTDVSSYKTFYEHTLKVHDMTPLTNHMGLRVLIAHKPGTGLQSGRMKYTKDTKLVDPFEVWKRMRNERYAKYRWLAYGLIAATFALFAATLRRVKSMWIALCLGQIWIIMLSQLTCYYYSFMILSAPLTRVNKQLQAWLFGLAALSQFVWITFYWNDDKYTVLTGISLAFCFMLLCAFDKRPWNWIAGKIRGSGDGDRAKPAGEAGAPS